ncbi:MAG: hypothetical protein JWN76_485 [Chitinophagaceae bacterium]|nr:hypothetical protein [Chitinophagaceae bacterium]
MKIIVFIFLFLMPGMHGKAQSHHFDNEFAKFRSRSDYYNWKIFLIADPVFLASIKQVEYYLDPSFRNSTRIITANNNNPNFTLCCNGWGEFTLRIKIVFKENRRVLNEVYNLDLHSVNKKSPSYNCIF